MSMTARPRAVVTLPSDTEIRITREFTAPPHLIYKAWTTPELIRRWWSAKRGTVTLAEVDLQVGGKWRFVMIADGGFEVGFHGEYREIVPARRLVFTEAFEGMPDADTAAALTSVNLVEPNGRTLVTILVKHQLKAHRDAHIESGMEDGLQDALDLMEEVAASVA